MRKPATPPDGTATLAGLELSELVRATEAARAIPDYPSWDKLRRRPAVPGLTHEQLWMGVRFSRGYEPLALTDRLGVPFLVSQPPLVQQLLHEVSIRTAGMLTASVPNLPEAQVDRFLMSSIREEAVSSSLLEGAVTTRRVAHDMLRAARPPRTKGERMVANNFAAMQWIREHRDDDITEAAVLKLHAILTEGTLVDPADEGRLQTPDEERVVVGGVDDDVLHEPPPADQLPARLARLCDFANGSATDQAWLHPLVRAIVVHFMFGYDHYFVDGNGRTARALFYWVALREGHWLIEFLSLSQRLAKAPAKYARAYLDTEVDRGDVTYFLIHQLTTLHQALDDLDEYLARKAREDAEAARRAHSMGLNHRQLAVFGRALSDPNATFTVKSHANSHRITLQTARTDLSDLESRGILAATKVGRVVEWRPVVDLGHAMQPRREL